MENAFIVACGIIVIGVFVMLAAAVVAVPVGFLLMISAGILHGQWSDIPAFGFWVGWAIVVSLSIIGSCLFNHTKTTND